MTKFYTLFYHESFNAGTWKTVPQNLIENPFLEDENIVENGRNVDHQHFLFITYFFTTKSQFKQPKKRSLLKTLWEKEKMLVTSIFSFSLNVFYPIKDRNKHLSYIYFVIWKCFQFVHIQNFVVWLRVTVVKFENIVTKGLLFLGTNFCFLPQCFS